MVREPEKRAKIRVHGLVRSMNRARDELAAGIPPEEAENFRRWVTETVEAVETICYKNKISPEALPAPSYHAYQYLKNIDLSHLPKAEPGKRTQTGQIRIKGLVAFSDQVQGALWQLADGVENPDPTLPTLTELHLIILGEVSHVEKLIRAAKSAPRNLPAPSWRAYAWLKFLSDQVALESHLQALTLIRQYANPKELSKAGCVKRNQRVQEAYFSISFANIPGLYRSRVQPQKVEITFHEGYITAPEKLLRVLVCAALNRERTRIAEQAKEYAESEDFTEVMLALELAGEEPKQTKPGRHHQLERVFQRVNQRYFKGKIERPRLVWNTTLTQRKMGHYNPLTDTLMISISLDTPEVPGYAIEFVMYHELLHKVLGTRHSGTRRMAHTPEFRKKEQQFREYQQAQTFLQSIASSSTSEKNPPTKESTKRRITRK
jgi:hypothetical protein